jgi:mannose-6-phosphate isomerase-like protein (cupin superfamily)
MSGGRSSRITSVEAGPIRADRRLVRLWGDDEAGWVNDWVYVSSERLYQIVLSMPPGASFRHSERNRTVFGADELYLVLTGTFALANPETGEVVRLGPGDAAWFGPDTWHHGFVLGDTEATVLEFFAPPPAAGMSQDYARTRPYLSAWRYTRDGELGGWPPPNSSSEPTLHPVVPEDTLWRLESEGALLVGILLSTSRLTVGTGDLLPGRATEDRRHDGDLGLYVREGELTVAVARDGGHELVARIGPDDGFYLPGGTAYRLANRSGERASFVFGVAPSYEDDRLRPGS